MSMGNKSLMVAAIDFGTTYSGYAFSFRHEFESDPFKVHASTWTAGSSSVLSLKTSSCILFRPNGQFDSFGFEAEDRYSDLALDNDHKDWFYFRRFKMRLYDSKDVHWSSKLVDETGKEMPSIEVFGAAIRYLKDHMMKSCTDMMHGSGIDEKEIKWVLTVPAIWDDAAKHFMRKAAEQAGIPGENLVLALEPEAASMFCKYLPVERMIGSADKKLSCFQPKSRYLVLDAGGGTIDITIHEVQRDLSLRELHKANGGAWGGTSIDQTFMEFIENIAGRDVITKFREDYKDDFIDLFREFEVKKRTIRPDTDSKITLKVPISLHELYREIKGDELREAARNHPDYKGKVTLAGDKMRVDAEVVKSLFQKTSDRITEHIKGILKSPDTAKTDVILMVGGFSESPMLQAAVQKAFPSMRVIIPHEAGLAVLKGAVIFGHNDREITSRVAKYTYGFKMYEPFDPEVHPKEKMIFSSNGEKMVQGVFVKLVEAGQSISPDMEIREMTCGPSGGGTGFTLKLFATPYKNPKFVDDEGSMSIGEVYVSCDDGRGNISSSTVSMVFGGTELQAKAVNTKTKKSTLVALNFLD